MRQQDSSEGAADRTTINPGFLSGRSIAHYTKFGNGEDRPGSQTNAESSHPATRLFRDVPIAYLLHLLCGAKVNSPKPASGRNRVEAQMQMARMLHNLGKLK